MGGLQFLCVSFFVFSPQFEAQLRCQHCSFIFDVEATLLCVYQQKAWDHATESIIDMNPSRESSHFHYYLTAHKRVLLLPE